jgi:hypothetical protein
MRVNGRDVTNLRQTILSARLPRPATVGMRREIFDAPGGEAPGLLVFDEAAGDPVELALGCTVAPAADCREVAASHVALCLLETASGTDRGGEAAGRVAKLPVESRVGSTGPRASRNDCWVRPNEAPTSGLVEEPLRTALIGFQAAVMRKPTVARYRSSLISVCPPDARLLSGDSKLTQVAPYRQLML